VVRLFDYNEPKQNAKAAKNCVFAALEFKN